MEIFTIKGFKCFADASICLNDMTVLVGANGYGKSSTIQALLLFRQATEKKSVNLNGDFGLELGEVIDIINSNYSDPVIVLSLADKKSRQKLAECFFDIENMFTFSVPLKFVLGVGLISSMINPLILFHHASFCFVFK